MAKLLGIAVKPQKRQPMLACAIVDLSVEVGIAGDWRGKPGPRQVTLMSQTAWHAACAELGVHLPWEARRANLLVDDLPLSQAIGAHILLGDAVLEITGETDPCSRMEAVHPGLRNALGSHWRGGVCCRVLQGGLLVLGMEVILRRTSPFLSTSQKSLGHSL
jgi:MOSC domain-containing protein YiiM